MGNGPSDPHPHEMRPSVIRVVENWPAEARDREQD